MGRGVSWTDIELSHLARAWMHASKDAIVGVEQTATRFNDTMSEKFKFFAPPGNSDKTYGGRTAKSVRSKFDEVPADIQKFRASLRLIRACNPTGVTEDEVIAMAIAKNLGKGSEMSYDARNFPHTQWKNHLAFKALQTHPKFSDEGSTSGTDVPRLNNPDENLPADSSNASTEQSEEVNNDNVSGYCVMENVVNIDGEDKSQEPASAERSEPGTPNNRPPGRKYQIRMRQTDKFRERAVINGEKIAYSMEIRTRELEEKNALLAYASEDWETEEDKQECAEFFRLVRRKHMKRMQKILQEGEERGAPVHRGGYVGPSRTETCSISQDRPPTPIFNALNGNALPDSLTLGASQAPRPSQNSNVDDADHSQS